MFEGAEEKKKRATKKEEVKDKIDAGWNKVFLNVFSRYFLTFQFFHFLSRCSRRGSAFERTRSI